MCRSPSNRQRLPFALAEKRPQYTIFVRHPVAFPLAGALDWQRGSRCSKQLNFILCTWESIVCIIHLLIVLI